MLQVGLIGYGLSGSVFHAPLLEKVEGLTLKAVVSSNAAKVHESYPNVKIVPHVQELLLDEEIDIVIVTSPNTTHYDYAKAAILKGKHVVVEKPFTIHSSEAAELIALAREKGVILTVYQNRRWDNDFLTVQNLLEKNALGNVSTYEAHYDRFRPEVKNRWREMDIPGSGILYDLGSHLIDQALTLFGMPKTIWADLRKEREGAEAIDYFHLVLGYENRKAILHSSSIVREPGPRFMVHGDKGSFIKYGIDPQEEQLKAGIRPGDPKWGKDLQEDFGLLVTDLGGLTMRGKIETRTGQYEAFYEKLVEAIQCGSPAPVLAEDAYNTIRIIEHAIKSNQEKQVITI